MRRRRLGAAGAAVALTLWALALAVAALHGFWRPPLTRATEPGAFADAARASIPAEFLGNLSLVVLQDGQVVAEVQSGPDGAVPGRGSVFQVASLSKWVTASGVLALAEQGRIGLDDPAEDHLLRWRFPESAHDSGEVTVRRLLSHTGGLSDGLGYNGFADRAEVQTLADSLDGAADAMEGATARVAVGHRPGARFAYSGGGYTVLQMLVEDVTGSPFPQAMDDLVFGPLGMEASSYDRAEVASVLAPAFDGEGRPVALRHYTALAAASLFTSSGDMAVFLGALYLPRQAGGLLGPEMRAAMTAPEARVLGVPVWGLGTTLYVSGPGGAVVVGHDGRNVPAINTAARLHAGSGDGIVVLATGTGRLASDLADAWVYWRTGRVSLTALGGPLRMAALAWAAGLAVLAVGWSRAARRG